MSYQPLRPPSEEFLTVRGLRHRVTRWGDRAQTPVVLLHGFQDCGTTWQFLVDALPWEWSLAAPDWRGFGQTAAAPGGYWFPDYFADLDALLEILAPGAPARIVGHSMGANIAHIYAGVRPERLAWLVNLEGFGLPDGNPQDAPARYAQWLDELRQPLRQGRYRSVAQLAGILRAKNPRLTSDRAEFIASAWTRPVQSAPDATDVELLFDPRHRLVNPILYRREEAQACWARIRTPVLLVKGEAGDARPLTRRAGTDDLRARTRNLEVVAIASAGHMLHHDVPDVLARHVVEFDRACRDRSGAAPPPQE